MQKSEICERLEAVCKALDNVTVSGVQNISNIAGSFAILNEILIRLEKEPVTEGKDTKQ